MTIHKQTLFRMQTIVGGNTTDTGGVINLHIYFDETAATDFFYR
jgi:hypothetical protein